MKKASDENRLLKIDALPNVFTSQYAITVVTWFLVFPLVYRLLFTTTTKTKDSTTTKATGLFCVA